MKKMILILLVTLIPTLAFAQEQTLLGGGEIKHGGYVALETKFTTVSDDFALLVGCRAAWILNSTFGIGIGGYGLVTEHQVADYNSNTKVFFETGYGGLTLDYIHNSDKLVHFTVSTLVGFGGAIYTDVRDWEQDDRPRASFERDTYFVLEPGINAELNVAPYFRINLGGSYRYINGLNLSQHTSKDFTGFSGNITFKVGLF
jgi:hypothetical protein